MPRPGRDASAGCRRRPATGTQHTRLETSLVGWVSHSCTALHAHLARRHGEGLAECWAKEREQPGDALLEVPPLGHPPDAGGAQALAGCRIRDEVSERSRQ